MNPFPLWRGITRHITQEAAEAFAAFVDSLPLDRDTQDRAIYSAALAVVVLFCTLNIGA